MDWWAIISNALRTGIGSTVIIFALAAIGLNLHFGYTGLLNFGQVGFMAAGAYGVGIMTRTYHHPLWAGVLVGFGAGLVLALLLGLPTLRLRADYLAIVTIAAGEILRLVVRAARLQEYTGGSSGLNGVADEFQDKWNFIWTPEARYGERIFGGRLNFRFTGGELWEMLVGWSLVLVCLLVMWLLISSPWGRVLRSIREDEDAARSLGKNVFRFKMQSLVLGGLFGTLAGIFWALQQNSVQPDNYVTPQTFFALTAAIIGGLGRIWGPVVGAMIFWMLLSLTENILRQAQRQDYLPESLIDGVQVGQVRFILTGLGLMLLMVFRPQGIFGDKREIAIDVRK
ncbi:MAG: branched-chain amino acid ABC transporter permease [Chloroflexi bacterium]|nr:branched-chain amino acid ABC transporter permease [Chloroflexota bacterium]